MSSFEFGDMLLISVLGRGGMADVFLAARADQIAFGVSKLVVIKRLREDLAEDPQFIGMFIDEARLAARLNHPNIVQTQEVGRFEDQYYLSMEYLDGQPLHRVIHRLRAAGQSTQPVVYSAMCEVLSGLQYAHDLKDFDGSPLKIVHRDVTPQNVFITYEGAVKVVDFGIAKAVGRKVETQHGIIKGKIAYLSPEQAMARPDIDGRADIFAVGVMLAEAAIGGRLWKGIAGPDGDIEILKALIEQRIPASPKERVPETPDAIDAICRKALAYSPGDRYAQPSEMQAELEAFVRSSGMEMSRKELGAIVSGLFANKRAEVRTLIESRLNEFKHRASARETVRPADFSFSSESTESLPNIVNDDSLPSSGRDRPRQSATPLIMDREGDPTLLISSLSASKPRGWRKTTEWIVVGGAILTLVGVSAAFVMRSRRPPPVVDTLPVAASPASASPTVEKVQIILRATPPEATFRIDDGPALDNPYVGLVPRSAAKHTVVIQAQGYVDRMRTVRFETNLTLDLSLEKASQGAP